MKAARRHQYRGLTATACAGALAIACLAGVTTSAGLLWTAAAQASAGRVQVAGTRPAWAVPARLAALPDTARTVTARVYLAGRDPAGLAAYATAVSDPRSRSFRKFLTSSQEQQRFGPTSAQVSAVTGWLRSAGLRVTGVTRHYVAVSGSVAAAQDAFAVRLASFRVPGGAVAMAPEQTVTVPAAVRSAVLTVTGLDTETIMMQPTIAGVPDSTRPQAGLPSAFYTAGPCSRYYGQHRATTEPKAYGSHALWAVCGYSPQQIRGAYGLTGSKTTGSGVTVAIVDAYSSPTMPADANAYAKATGFAGLSQSQFQQSLPGSFDQQSACGASSWYEEETLDIEAVHTMAPGANIEYVAASDCTLQSLLDAITSVVDNQLGDVVTDSWTGVEDGLTSSDTSEFDQVFEQGATEGIGFDFAAGDCGYNSPKTSCGQAAGSGQVQVNFPTSSQWVTGVGGTALAIGKGAKYEWETGWGDMVVPQDGSKWKHTPPGSYPSDYAFGGGGGTSTLYTQPSWQAGVVPKALATRLPSGRIAKTPMRVVPDVALDADPATGFLIGETVRLRNGKDGFMLSRVGGTSLATPLFAGLEADAAALSGSNQLGFIDPLLYQLAGTAAFHDVTDSPLGHGVRIALVRNEWANSAKGTGKIDTTLYTLGMDGSGGAALQATKGYDNVTGLGSPTAKFVADLAAAASSG
ncbi:MAG TPA: S53 family peptidase [Streptosporangiaceae bacterium]|nr:S53 family peptidase [Streptosporangiaceae bacterium]